ncbi:MAG: FMN-dependent NADH-azoreductase [Myxococcota bacterium]
MSPFTILRLDASARISRSLSRGLADEFVRGWGRRRPDDRVLLRDVGIAPPPPISEPWIGAAFTPEAQRTERQRALLSLSDELIEELRQADLLLIATPMYNYGMPAALKAWVDQVVRVHETFTFDLGRGDWPIEPVLEGKTLVLLTSSGEFGFAPGGVRAELDHLTPHLRTCSRYLGVAETHRVAIEYQEFGDERHRRSVEEARAEVGRLVEHLSRCVTSDAA